MTVHSKKFLSLCSVLFSFQPVEGWWNSVVLHSASSRPSSTALPQAFSYFGGEDGPPSNQAQRKPIITERGSSMPSISTAPPDRAMVRSTPAPLQRRSGMPQITPLERSDRRSQSLTTPEKRSQREIYDDSDVKPTTIQGSSLRTWSFTTDKIQSVQVSLFTEGRPLSANVDVWTGPDSTPQRMSVYLEDGSIRPFNAVVFVPSSVGGQKHAVAVKNTGQMAFPIQAAVEVGSIFSSPAFSMDDVAQRLFATHSGKTIQGGSVKTIPFSPSVTSIQLLLNSDGRPLNARIEMLQGPDNVKQVMEIHTEDGNARPFFAIIETPGYGNVVRIKNTGPMEFPIECRVEPYTVEDDGLFDPSFGDPRGDFSDRRDDWFSLPPRR
ncbi:hypothetical protein IV203_016392 [Nitzschia inconspicua]|uniref:Uncharacterized protein n=1 Tax=Nitzschia inconspicua TaxID=303405 RepID=A0A9K3KPW9_9STRA|nr:hypothetical protein IV203_016392 [Nitzschia inconspicua]